MRIILHIGLQQVGADRLQDVLAEKRDQLISKGVLFARSPGNKNHTRLFMAVTDPDHIDPLRYNRGYVTAQSQAVLRDTVIGDLTREVAQHDPKVLILSCAQLGTSLARKSELERLKSLLEPLSTDITILAHVDEQTKLLARYYGAQIFEGRSRSLALEQQLAKAENWWQACLENTPQINADAGVFSEIQGPPFWLDYCALVDHWQSVFGAGTVQLRPYDSALFASKDVTRELRAAFAIKAAIGKADNAAIASQPSAATLTRGRMLNALVLKVLSNGKRVLPRQLWRS
ncbi:MAG: glycosyltransferase family 2 protein, partial [Sulfitobacter sp.]